VRFDAANVAAAGALLLLLLLLLEAWQRMRVVSGRDADPATN